MSLTPIEETRQCWNTEKIITFDVETEGWTNPVAIGWHHPNNGYSCVHTGDVDDPAEYFVEEVLLARKNRGFRFVAHNGGNFDFGFLLPHLFRNDDIELQLLKRGNGEIFFVKITKTFEREVNPQGDVEKVKHNRYLQDSLALLPRGLDYLTGAYADTENIEMDESEYEKINNDWESMEEEFRTELQEYLKNDCITLREILNNFTDTVNELAHKRNVGCSLTMGSTTMNMYRTNYLEDDAESQISEPTPEIEEKFRKSYYAGRTEVFRHTANKDDYPLYHYDINSLFPHCYTNRKLPVGNPSHYENVTTEKAKKIINGEEYGGAVKIKGTVPQDVKYPVLPRRVDTQEGQAEKVIFATGNIEGWYMMREVEYAVEVGALDEDFEVDEMVIAENKNQFEEYGEELYTLKNEINKEENPGKYVTVKLLLNSFYGKFAMSREQDEIRKVKSIRELDEKGLDWEPVGSGGHHKRGKVSESQAEDLVSQGVISQKSKSNASYILPRIASCITADARIEMNKWFRRVTEAGGKIYYCDTDSVVCDIPLEDIQPEEGAWVNEELGGMDKENVIADYIALRPKTYAELPTEEGEKLDGTVIKGKGMRDLESDVEFTDGEGETVVSEALDFEDFKLAFENNEPERIGVKWKGVRGISATLKDNWTAGVQSESYQRSLTGFDDKRKHSENGTDSEPLTVNDF